MMADRLGRVLVLVSVVVQEPTPEVGRLLVWFVTKWPKPSPELRHRLVDLVLPPDTPVQRHQSPNVGLFLQVHSAEVLRRCDR